MAIDTREKRQAVSVVSMYWKGPTPTPTVGKDQEWRQEVAWGYPGILAMTPIVIAWFNGLTTSIRLTGVGQA